MSRRDRRGDGGDLVMDFWSSSSSTSRQRLLQRWREGGGWCAGAATVGLLWLAVVRWMPWPVLGLRLVEGRSGADLRRRRRGAPDLEVEDVLGAGPRPASHSDMWASLVLLFSRFTKPFVGDGAASSSASLVPVSPSRGARSAGAGDGRRVGSGGAGIPRDFVVFSAFLRGFSALCTGLRVLLDPSVLCVRILYSGLSTT